MFFASEGPTDLGKGQGKGGNGDRLRDRLREIGLKPKQQQ